MNNFLYLLPSMFTAGNMFSGFFSIITSLKNNFETASWAVIVAIIFDGLDGIISRLCKEQDLFGVEFDSLADLVSFCIAPMVLLYRIVLYNYGSSGILIAFIYILFGSIRLARYNVVAIKEKGSNIFFEGLPTPAAAGAMVSIVLLLNSIEQNFFGRKNVIIVILPVILKFLPIIILVVSVLMITKLRYISFSKLKINRRVTFKMFTLIVGVLLLIFAYPESTIFLVFGIYIITGFVDYLIRIYKIRATKYFLK
ncbi:MAG: CDP-diacylglycerol--serine O-phosphatidyltransferase [Endomicrobiia bacterium]